MITVSQLIASAQHHLEVHGDTAVNVVMWDPKNNHYQIELATELCADVYDKDGPWFYEIEGTVTEDG